jgi:hypothetical protein
MRERASIPGGSRAIAGGCSLYHSRAHTRTPKATSISGHYSFSLRQPFFLVTGDRQRRLEERAK